MAQAAVDVGSNSVKLVLAADLSAPLLDMIVVTGLGEGLGRDGRLGEAAMARTLDALANLMAAARARGAREFAAVGTAALRGAANAADFLARAEARCGLEIAVIPGEEEARLAFLAARSGAGAPPGPCLVFDIGGGSTEFVAGEGDGGRMADRFSLPLGCLRLTEEFQREDPASPAALAAMLAACAERLAPLAPGAGSLIGIGGTATSLGTVALAAPDWQPARVEGLALTREEVERQLALYRRLTVAERAVLPGLMPERAPVILAGAAIVLSLMQRRGADRLVLSARALRHGLWLDRWGRSR